MMEENGRESRALGHLRVIEIGGPAAAGCTMWFAGLGADVIKVEPPGGDRLRTYPPFAGDVEDIERSLYHLHFDAGKRSIVLDLEEAGARERFQELVRSADILVEAFPRGYMKQRGLGYERLHALHPGLVQVSVTAFGQTGPHRDFLGDDLIAMAGSGYMSQAGDDEKPPCVAPCFQAYQVAGTIGAYAALLALRHRSATGVGQLVDLSLQQAMVYLYGSPLAQYIGNRSVVRRVGTANFGGAVISACQDGHIIVAAFSARSREALEIGWMQDPILSEEPFKSDREYRRANGDVIKAIYEDFIAKFKVWDFVSEGQERHIPIAPVSTPKVFLESEQTVARGFIVEVEHPTVGTYQGLRGPFGMTATPWGPGRPAPLLDQDRAAILEDIAPKAAAPRGGAVDGDKRMPLEGVRILDFTRVRSGPTGTSILANYGAQVIKIESNTIDTFRNIELRTPQLDTLHRDKESIQLNLKDPRARDLFLDLAKQSDVVIENFTYKVMDDLGLSYEELRQAKPDIILAGMPPLGKTGPFAWWTTYGQQLMGLSGMSYLWGYPDSPMEAHPKIPYPDDTAAAQLVFAVMAALEHRDRTGEGQYIEIAQVEGLAFLLAPAYMDYLINGREWGPLGNVHPVAAPFGVYGAQGYDAWVAVSCETEDHWRALVAAMGAADWVQDERFSTRSGRREHKGDLDAYLEEWTSQRTPRQAMWELQMAGVPAFEVPNNEDLYYDLHLRDRGFLTRGSFPGFEDAEYREALVALSESPGRVRKGAPVEGADNYEIFGDLLGLSKEEVDRLVEEKVIH